MNSGPVLVDLTSFWYAFHSQQPNIYAYTIPLKPLPLGPGSVVSAAGSWNDLMQILWPSLFFSVSSQL